MSGLVILIGVGLISGLVSLSVALALVARDAWAKRLA